MPLESYAGTLLNFLLPLPNLDRMNAVLLTNQVYRLRPAQRPKTDFRLELRRVHLPLPRFAHHYSFWMTARSVNYCLKTCIQCNLWHLQTFFTTEQIRITCLMKSIGKLLRQAFSVPTYARQSEAFHTVLAHSTPRRLFNLVLTEIEYRMRRTRVSGRPYVVVIDPANVCNLRCPLCPTGLLDQGRRGQMMPWETFTRTIDMAAPWAYKVNLFNWGEPLLHPHVFDMIRYAHSKGLGTTMSTNLSVKLSDENIDSLIESGLEFLCLSIDGATQANYAHYRRKGNLELVLANARRLMQRRRELGRRTPVVEWQFIPMKHNEHEEAEARRLAAEIGVDRFRCIPVGLPFDSAEPARLKDDWFPVSISDGHTAGGEDVASNEQAATACYFLYRYLVVNPDGKVSPCCVVYGEKNDFGDVASSTIDTLWNNAVFRSGRAQHSPGGHVEVPTVCDRCYLFAKHAKLANPAVHRVIPLVDQR